MRARIVQGLIIGVAATTVALLAWFGNTLNWIELPSWDWRARALAGPGDATPQIRIVLIDQESLDWASQPDGQDWPWPWPRIAYGAMLDICRRGGARSVTLDFLFTEPSIWNRIYGDDDVPLGDALAETPGAVVGVQLSHKRIGNDAWPPGYPADPRLTPDFASRLQSVVAPRWTLPNALFPVPDIGSRCAHLGSVFAESDPDGKIRRLPPFQFFNGRPVPVLGMASFLAGHPGLPLERHNREIRLGPHTLPLDAHGQVILRYRGPSQAHPTRSAQAVVQSAIRLMDGTGTPVIDPAWFRDAHVFIGSSAPALMDLRSTPLTRIYPGVEVHATFLDNLLSGDFIRDTRPLTVLLWTLAFGLAAGIGGRLCQSGRNAALAFAVLLPPPVLVGFAAYHQGFWLPIAPQEVAVILGLVSALIVNYALEGRQKRFIKNAFQQYLSPPFIERLLADPSHLKLGGETRELSIYFSDVQGFTTISESLTPEQLTALLNEYLTAMTDIIMEEGGTVDKYEGDAIIAFWNAPLDLPGHAACAVRSALRCQAALAAMRPALKEKYGKDLFCRVGLNTGKVVIGNMGSNQRFNYTFLGDAGNLAARLEGANKQFGTYMMISEFTRSQMSDEFACRELSRLRVKGKLKPVGVFEPMFKEDYERRREILDCFERALQAYYGGRFKEALDGFSGIADRDPAAQSYVRRCHDLLEHPPAEWDGVWELTEK